MTEHRGPCPLLYPYYRVECKSCYGYVFRKRSTLKNGGKNMRLQQLEIATRHGDGSPVIIKEINVRNLRDAVCAGRKRNAAYGKWRVVRENGQWMTFSEACAQVAGFGEGWHASRVGEERNEKK